MKINFNDGDSAVELRLQRSWTSMTENCIVLTVTDWAGRVAALDLTKDQVIEVSEALSDFMENLNE